MPYTSTDYPFRPTTWYLEVRFGSGSPSWRPWDQSNQDTMWRMPGVVHYNRIGTNLNVPVRTVRDPSKKPTGPLVWVLRPLPRGPKLPVKIFSKRLNKWVYKRKLVETWVLRPSKVKTKKKSKPLLDAAPNALNYRSARVRYFGEDLTVIAKDTSVPGYINEKAISGDVFRYGPGLFSQFHMVPGQSSAPFQTAIQEATNRALPQLYAEVKNQSVNLAQAFMEVNQSVKMFKEIFRKLVITANAMRKGNISKALAQFTPTHSKDVSNAALMFQYGIRPLLSDLDGAMEHLAIPEKITRDIKRRIRVEVPSVVLVTQTYTSGLFQYTDTVRTSGFVDVTFKVRVTASRQGLDRENVRLGFVNLASLAWEATPFSFIGDWFLPVGDYLNNLDAFMSLDRKFVTKTEFSKEYLIFERKYGGSSPGSTCSDGITGYIVEHVNCYRTILPDIPYQPLPAFKNPFSKEHLFNASALAIQLRK